MKDEPALVVEVVVVGDGLADVPVLLRGPGGVELLELEPRIHDGLQQVQRPEHIGRHGLVRPVPRLADMRLGAEVEHVRPIGRGVLQLANEVVDRRAVGEVREVDLQPAALVADVVQRSARGRADECVHRRAELDQRVREVRSHEAVGARDEDGAALVDVRELAAEVVERGACPEGVVRHGPYASASVSKRTDTPGLGSLGSGALTAVSALVVMGASALAGVIIARELGRTDETDGFFAAYSVFIVIVLVAQAIRVAVLPALARARVDNRLGGELAGYAAALGAVALPLAMVAELAAQPLAAVLTGDGSEAAQQAAADTLRVIVPAAVAQLFAGVAASGLAAMDDYATAAFGYALGSALGIAFILQRVGEDGIAAVAWGMGLNAGVALAVPLAGLAYRARGYAHAGLGVATERASAALAPRIVRDGDDPPARAATPLRHVCFRSRRARAWARRRRSPTPTSAVRRSSPSPHPRSGS